MTTMEKNRNNRRGVTLLLVLSLMAMFAMLVVTFMIVTTQARNAADITAEAILNPKDKNPTEITDKLYRAFDVLLVGGLDTAIGPHGILENLYGHPVCEPTNPANPSFEGIKGTFASDNLSTDHNDDDATVLYYNPGNSGYFGYSPFSNAAGPTFYMLSMIGKVVTVTELPSNPTDRQKELLGKSTFVTGMYGMNDGNRVELAPFQVSFNAYDQRAELIGYSNQSGGCKFIVNSPAFSGTGPGFDRGQDADDPALAFTDSGSSGVLYALRPNAMAPNLNGYQAYRDYLENNLVMMNPDYTAPDFLNMFLAWYDVDESDPQQINDIIPSFHRPDLIRYHLGNSGTTNIDLFSSNLRRRYNDLRKVVLRPTPFDHPDFTGSNSVASRSRFLPTGSGSSYGKSFIVDGPWDVDNDGDGIADSVWLDVGLPIMEDKTTNKMYRPLAAFLVLDMDGRLNVNAHGNAVHALATGFDGSYPTDLDKLGGVEVRGSGSGPAEVRLDKTHIGNLKELLLGEGGSGNQTVAGRYGDSSLAGASATVADLASIPAPGEAQLGDDTELWDSNPFIWNMGVRANAYNYNYVYNDNFKGFGGLYPDWWGHAALAFDPLGNRFPVGVSNFPNDMHLYRHNPYLVNPYGDTPATMDDPFGADVLQFLLRMPGDDDYKNLPTRLRELLGENTSDATQWSRYRFTATTRGSDIPSPSYYVAGNNRTLFNLIQNATGNASAALLLYELLPEEIRRGERIDLNRLSHSENWAPTTTETTLTRPKRRDMLKEKAKFAQGIFLLLMVLCQDQLSGGVEGMSYEEAVTRLAQWSVNLVDFMDPDAVMTPLIFNMQPFTTPTDYASNHTDAIFDNTLGTGVLGGNVRIVWGMEQPEVALTKTFATHNLRIADTKWGTQGSEAKFHGNNPSWGEGAGNGCPHNPPCGGKHLNRIADECTECNCGGTHDTDFDQILIPQGSLFLEIYRKGDPNRANYMADMYRSSTTGKNDCLDLGKKIDDYFVWRLAIGKATRSKAAGAPTNRDISGNDVFGELDTKGLTYTFQPKKQWPDPTDDDPFDDDPLSESASGTGNCMIVPERFIFFGSAPANPDTRYKDISYYNYGAPRDVAGGSNNMQNVLLEPNEYLVIGPRQYTSFMSKPVRETEKGEGPDVGETEEFGTPKGDSKTYIDLVELQDVAETDGAKRPKVMVAAAPLPSGWETTDTSVGYVLSGAAQGGIGASVSEPLLNAYYPKPSRKASAGLITALAGIENPGEDDSTVVDGYEKENADKPLDEDEDFYGFGTIPCYKAIFLQRLADPNRPHDEVTNPYITVDWNMIDLHVFNSEVDMNSTLTTRDKIVPALKFGDGSTDRIYMGMRQWGYTAKLADPTNAFPNIWDRSFDSSKIGNTDGGLLDGGSGTEDPELHTNTVFGRLVNYDGISEILKVGDALPNDPTRTIQAAPSDNVGNSDNSHFYIGAPEDTAWQHYAWNNAPLTNTLELMQVPASSAGRFGFECRDNRTGSSLSGGGSLGTGGRFGGSTDNSPVIGPYLNFFNSDTSTSDSLNLVRFLEYVRVPSRFVGTIRGWTDDGKPIYAMREPGKINLNTATAEAWKALSGSLSGSDWYDYDELKKIRETGTGNSGTYPTRFAFPFRSPGAGNLVPDSNMLREKPHEATILRDDFDSSTASWSASGTFFRADDEASNQYTLLENIQRLSDVTTNRSNVFAVWVTIGYFEVDKYSADGGGIQQLWNDYQSSNIAGNFPNSGSAGDPENTDFFNAVYPGGYVLKKEKGLSDGTVKRNRAFFLIDRSIPVGFRREKTYPDENDRPTSIRNVIVLERSLE